MRLQPTSSLPLRAFFSKPVDGVPVLVCGSFLVECLSEGVLWVEEFAIFRELEHFFFAIILIGLVWWVGVCMVY
jgi:hypothetical protein